MSVKILLALFCFCFAFTQVSYAGSDWQNEKGTYAVFKTSLGEIVCKLFPDRAPETVANLIGLAEGTKEYVGRDGKKTKGKFYDGTIFHRVIPNFMIQGGDPSGTGRGGPGYKFKDEFDPRLTFDKPGKLAMANAGRNTNGSQFFITHVPTPFLNKKHTIFGEVVQGQDIVVKIGGVKMDRRDKPLEDVVLEHLGIVRVK
jgi:peptidyl-prolyl cis-trans isomerase A (cyclophilin A)